LAFVLGAKAEHVGDVVVALEDHKVGVPARLAPDGVEKLNVAVANFGAAFEVSLGVSPGIEAS